MTPSPLAFVISLPVPQKGTGNEITSPFVWRPLVGVSNLTTIEVTTDPEENAITPLYAPLRGSVHLPSPEPEPWPEALLLPTGSVIRLSPALCSGDHVTDVFL